MDDGFAAGLAGIADPGRLTGREIIFFPSAGSTNTLAADLAAQGAPEGTVVIADSQTAGRGRLGRSWFSPPGANLYMSVILRPRLSPAESLLLTLMTAVACAHALSGMLPSGPAVKWPNDLIVNRRKLGGILTEMRADRSSLHFAIVGIGINVNTKIADMSEDLRGTATSLAEESGRPESRLKVTSEVLNHLDHWYSLLTAGRRREILDAWRSLSASLGTMVRVTNGPDLLTGYAEDIDEYGYLIVRTGAGPQRITAGDVEILGIATGRDV